MRRRAHQLAYVRRVVPDVCPWLLRFQCCPTLDLAAPAAFSAEAAGRASQRARNQWYARLPAVMLQRSRTNFFPQRLTVSRQPASPSSSGVGLDHVGLRCGDRV